MRYVYFHELMHQYFDRFDSEKDEMEIEEGLAEFGALYVLDSLVEKGEADTAELDWTLRHIRNHQWPQCEREESESFPQNFRLVRKVVTKIISAYIRKSYLKNASL